MLDSMWRYRLQQVKDMQVEYQPYTRVVLNGDVAALPENVPAKHMTLQQVIEGRGTLHLLTCLDAGFGDGMVS
jgi:hypothetical protein